MPAFRKAMAAMDGERDHEAIAERWKLWLAVRAACPVGREHRYTDQQIRYHYVKQPNILGS